VKIACPCGSTKTHDACCGPVIRGERAARTAEELMRARYSAYATREIGFLHDSLHPDQRSDYDEKTTRDWAERAEWRGLTIHETTAGGPDDEEGTVEFTAAFAEKGEPLEHRELATFRRQGGAWYFETGKVPPVKQYVRESPKVGRNEPCPCGSGKKHKRCCGA
jgi:SEC-C motif-containing protein